MIWMVGYYPGLDFDILCTGYYPITPSVRVTPHCQSEYFICHYFFNPWDLENKSGVFKITCFSFFKIQLSSADMGLGL